MRYNDNYKNTCCQSSTELYVTEGRIHSEGRQVMQLDVPLLLLTVIIYTVQCLPLDDNDEDEHYTDNDKVEGTSDVNVTPSPIKLEDIINWQRGPDSYEVAFDGFRHPVTIRRSLRSSVAEPWPIPRVHHSTNHLYRIHPHNFTYIVKSHSCDVIDDAIRRYNKTIFEHSTEVTEENFSNVVKSKIKDEMTREKLLYFIDTTSVPYVQIKIKEKCTSYPNASSDESYRLTVDPTGISLGAKEAWGVIRGLETLSQLVVNNTGHFYVRQASIRDSPRFQYRGFLLDTARHYITKPVILDVIEGMAQNKLNVLHWHIVDDQSFPYQSDAFPDLSKKGAYHWSMVYTRTDVADIIEFARLRGIRVIPEFDTPGHTYSWGLSNPDLLTQCYPGNSEAVPGYLGPMDPSNERLFRVLAKFFKEVLMLFKDPYLHLGNDEVFKECWASNPRVIELFRRLYLEEGIESIKAEHTDEEKTLIDIDIRILNRTMRMMADDEQERLLPKYVWRYFVKRMQNEFEKLQSVRDDKMEFIMWEDALHEDIEIPKDTIIQVWRTDTYLRRVLLDGYRVIYSYCWYLDRIDPGVHWHKFYQCDPYDNGRYAHDKAILGGEICMWGEYMSSEMLMKWLWPRGSAAAERLWSRREDTLDLFNAARRLEEHRCRMLRRGLDPGFANGPEFCLRKKPNRHNSRRTRYHVALSSNHSSVPRYPMNSAVLAVPWTTDTEVMYLFYMTSVSVLFVILMIYSQRKRRLIRCQFC